MQLLNSCNFISRALSVVQCEFVSFCILETELEAKKTEISRYKSQLKGSRFYPDEKRTPERNAIVMTSFERDRECTKCKSLEKQLIDASEICDKLNAELCKKSESTASLSDKV